MNNYTLVEFTFSDPEHFDQRVQVGFKHFVQGFTFTDDTWYFVGLPITFLTFYKEIVIPEDERVDPTDDVDEDYFELYFSNKGKFLKTTYKTNKYNREHIEEFVKDVTFDKQLKDILA